MKKIFKKLIAFVSAAALLSPLALIPSIDANANETTAFMQFASADWSVQTWGGDDGEGALLSNAAVNGEGTYTVGIEFEDPVDGIAFSSVEIADGEALYPGAYMNIDSVKVNGEEVDFASTYTNDEEGNIRTNLYNEWVGELPADARTNGADDVTWTPLANDIAGISSIEVTFTLELPKGTAYIQFASGDWAVGAWGFDPGDGFTRTNVDVSGYGTYTVGLEFDEPAAGIAFTSVEIAGGEVAFPSAFMKIDSVKVNGDDVEVGTTYSNMEEGNIRTNLYNEWVEEVTEGITEDGSFGDVTPTPIANDFPEINSFEVTFTIVKGVPFGGGEVEEDYEPPTAFNAFIMFQDNGGGEWSNFSPGVGNDTMILGDGVWEVSITREQAGGIGQAIPDESGLVFLVDIEELGKAMVFAGTLWEEDGLTGTDAEVSVEVYVDGSLVSGINNDNIKYGDIEGNGRLRLELVNTWGTGTLENPVVMPSRLVPNDEIKVVFTLKGTGYNSDFDWNSVAEEAPAQEEAPAAPPAEAPAPEPVAAESNNNTTLIIIIVIAVLAIACVAYIVISKKKKNG
ncbi:MAG: hypothetical protein FWG91_13585 [Lachnospiraceae bacterium]|nr:hypothetical protein [Lachnospiraceae bacterium]